MDSAKLKKTGSTNNQLSSSHGNYLSVNGNQRQNYLENPILLQIPINFFNLSTKSVRSD